MTQEKADAVDQVRFDSDLYRALVESKRASIAEGSAVIYPESLAVAVISSGPNLVTQILSVLNADIEKLHKRLKDILKRRCAMDSSGCPDYSSLVIGEDAKSILKMAEKISAEMGDIGIGVQHILLSVLASNKVIREIFLTEGVSSSPLREAFGRLAKTVVRKRTSQKVGGQATMPAVGVPAGQPQQQKKPQQGKQDGKPGIESYCRDLVSEAAAGKLMPVIGRDEEVDRVISILCRMTKNNPLLVGDAGVGKTAVVEGVAQRIACGSVPAAMRNRKIWHLDMSDFVSGTQFRGQFEERMKNLKEVFKDNPEYILFIDEVHAMLGAGGAMGSLDAGNILKPALARGELRCIGATTEDEAKKYLGKDSALNRRFQRVFVREPSHEETVRILYGLKDILEQHHGCTISPDAIAAAVEYSGRYITERKFPDKAIDCIDEMCATAFVHAKASQPKAVMTREDAALAVSKQSGISMDIILNDDMAKVSRIEKNLMSKVIGQDHAISAVSRALKRAYAGVRDPNRPIAVLFFGGQSGTGKTYVAELVNNEMFGSQESLIRINMTEFSEKHTVSRLVGSPPGYVGFGETNQLTDRVMRKPYSLLLIDEMEKAHQDVAKLFYQIFSKGSLTDAEGRTVSFRNTVIIITSNLGSDYHTKKSLGFVTEAVPNDSKSATKHLVEACKGMFGTPFTNRVDEFVHFNNLGKDDLAKIVSIRMDEIVERLAVKKVHVSYDPLVSQKIVDDMEDGHGVNANAVSTAIARHIEPILAEAMSSSEPSDSSELSILVSVDKSGKIISKKRRVKASK
jgi:ATP-dependent Clp protease ATP-binding subunit ClpC